MPRRSGEAAKAGPDTLSPKERRLGESILSLALLTRSSEITIGQRVQVARTAIWIGDSEGFWPNKPSFSAIRFAADGATLVTGKTY
jgi:hypothetical protein